MMPCWPDHCRHARIERVKQQIGKRRSSRHQPAIRRGRRHAGCVQMLDELPQPRPPGPRVGIGKRQIIDVPRQLSRGGQQIVDLLPTGPSRASNDQPRRSIGIGPAQLFDRLQGRIVVVINDQDQRVIVIILLEQRTQIFAQPQVQTAARHDHRRPAAGRPGQGMRNRLCA